MGPQNRQLQIGKEPPFTLNDTNRETSNIDIRGLLFLENK